MFFAKNFYPIHCEIKLKPIRFFSRLPNMYKNEFIVAFLKSSFNLWYMNNKFNSVDIYNPRIFFKIRIPILDGKNLLKLKIAEEISKVFNNILFKEKEFLKGKKDTRLVESHNKEIDILSYHIDQKIYELLGISKEQIKTIEDFLNIKKIYLPEEHKRTKQHL